MSSKQTGAPSAVAIGTRHAGPPLGLVAIVFAVLVNASLVYQGA